MRITLKTDFSNAKVREVPSVIKALEAAGKVYADRYEARVSSGIGVLNGDQIRLASNPAWVQKLKGHNRPLIGGGGLSKSIKTKVTGRSAEIFHSTQSVAGGINGQRTSKYSEVALRMQVGGKYSNVYIKYPGSDAVTRDTIDIIPRPHFFTTWLDRKEMAKPVFDEFRGFLARGLISR